MAGLSDEDVEEMEGYKKLAPAERAFLKRTVREATRREGKRKTLMTDVDGGPSVASEIKVRMNRKCKSSRRNR